MASQKTRYDKMLEALRRHDSRITPQRMAVLKILASSDRHPTVEHTYEQVKRRFPTISEKGDFKSQFSADKVVTVFEAFKDYKPKYETITLDAALAATTDAKRESRGPV